MTRGDRILTLVIGLIAVLAIPVMAAAVSHGGTDVVISGPMGKSVMSLDVDQTVTVAGLHGDVVVAVSGGAVRVAESSCPDRVCVHSKALDRSGGVIACVPNGVTVAVGTAGERGLDAIVR